MKLLHGICSDWRKVSCTAILVLFPVIVCAGNGVGRFFKKVGVLIDSATVRGIDSLYIQVPKQPWQVMARGNANEMKVDIGSGYKNKGEYFSWDMTSGTGIGSSFGAWAGYRGYGLGYLFTVGKQKGSNFTIGMGGSNYNLNLRIRKFQINDAEARLKSYVADEDYVEDVDEHGHIEFDDPIKVKSFLLEGYYMFNSKHFSNTAAYDQSTVQIRSAGSLIVGASWMEADIDYAENMNSFLVLMMNDVGRIKVHQVNLGAGYAYNWVPARRWLVNAMIMPTVSVFNKLKMWRYDYDFGTDEEDNLEITLEDVFHHHSKLMANVGGWLTVVYNSKHWFATARGQWGQYRFDSNNSNGSLKDWYVNMGVGIRL